MEQAACRWMAPTEPDQEDLFFPGPGQSAREAQMICITCPVFFACRDYQQKMKNTDGVWHGQHYTPKK